MSFSFANAILELLLIILKESLLYHLNFDVLSNIKLLFMDYTYMNSCRDYIWIHVVCIFKVFCDCKYNFNLDYDSEMF